MNAKHIDIISAALKIQKRQVENTVKLLDEKATVPFISRYRKEATGSLDEVAVGEIALRLEKLNELQKRKEAILTSIEKQELLTPELKKKLDICYDIHELEDIYLPYKPKRKTKASIAKERGLEPLADIIWKQQERNVSGRAEQFTNNEVPNSDAALEGACHIIAEKINEHQHARNTVRYFFRKGAVIRSRLVKGKEAEGEKFKDYFEFEEPLNRCSSHRLLAMRRGEREGFLKASIFIENEDAEYKLSDYFVKSRGEAADLMNTAIKDCLKRLLVPSVETEFSGKSKENADTTAIKVFAENLKQLLLASPLGEKRILALDPGYKSGCKLVCLDEHGNLLHNETIYPHPPQNQRTQAMKKIGTLVESFKIQSIAIGNGTASRETEELVKNTHFKEDMRVFTVSEAGASIYSASKIAREEFPSYDVTVRGAVSIGRRLADPLAELVKIDAKSIGVGQYQHDVDQAALKTSLDTVVEHCVNTVGVDVNTASKYLLTYVSGLGPQLAQNIVDYRKENGKFLSRVQLKKVPRMGPKAFEQAAGFLRIRGGKNPLDSSAVHPESYPVVERMAKDIKVKVGDLMADQNARKQVKLSEYITVETGLPTLNDIMSELEKPGRDPREKLELFEFDSMLKTIANVREGVTYPGVVTNVTNFGAFVDIGIKENGLVHISNLANKFIDNPADVVKVNQHVQVRVIQLDVVRKRIGLSMKDAD